MIAEDPSYGNGPGSLVMFFLPPRMPDTCAVGALARCIAKSIIEYIAAGAVCS